jgi:uncharacterized protein YkwD
MRRRPTVLLALALASLAALAAATAAGGGQQTHVIQHQSSLEQQVFEELNRVRAARGLPKIRTQAGLRSAANEHSRSMLSAGFFAHESPDGTPFHNRIRRYYPSQGWQKWSVGETLVSGHSTLDARAIVAAWLNSPSHRDVILSRSWRRVGLGAYLHPVAPGAFGGSESVVVTADFGLRVR